jgi:SAM-dependent methyltransferase
MKSIDPQVAREMEVHGLKWRTIHGGYFADPKVARPLILALRKAIVASSASVVVDLGGGTGFFLRELLKHYQYPGVRFIDLDVSERQLDEEDDPHITCLQASASEVTRELLDPGDETLLFVMRSVLHYFGYNGLRPILGHLRMQMKTGEYFVHQTACFERVDDAERLNYLYRAMQTEKWYPTVHELKECLEKEGWAVEDISPAPKLALTSDDLARRYHLSADDVNRIREEISCKHGKKPGVFEATSKGFTAYLHYRIFTCIAVNHNA